MIAPATITISQQRFHPCGKVESRRGERAWRGGYIGKDIEPDADLGLQRIGARYYAPELGRWVSADPLIGQDPALVVDRLVQTNLYSYSSNSPVMTADPDGEDTIWDYARAYLAFSGTSPERIERSIQEKTSLIREAQAQAHVEAQRASDYLRQVGQQGLDEAHAIALQMWSERKSSSGALSLNREIKIGNTKVYLTGSFSVSEVDGKQQVVGSLGVEVSADSMTVWTNGYSGVDVKGSVSVTGNFAKGGASVSITGKVGAQAYLGGSLGENFEVKPAYVEVGAYLSVGVSMSTGDITEAVGMYGAVGYSTKIGDWSHGGKFEGRQEMLRGGTAADGSGNETMVVDPPAAE